MKLITAVVTPSEFDAIKKALNTFGVTGLTITEVFQRDLTGGRNQVYRGQRFHADLHVSDSAHAKHANRGIDLIPRTLQDGHVRDHAPAPRKLIIQAHVEEKLMVLHLIVQQRALRLLDGSDEMPEGIEVAKPDIHGQAAQPQRIVILVIVRGERPLPAELVDDALIGARGDAALPVSFVKSAANQHCGQEKENTSPRHETR